jgi:hypothetical protein
VDARAAGVRAGAATVVGMAEAWEAAVEARGVRKGRAARAAVWGWAPMAAEVRVEAAKAAAEAAAREGAATAVGPGVGPAAAVATAAVASLGPVLAWRCQRA